MAENKGGGFAEPTMVLLLDKKSNEQFLSDTKLGVVDWFISGKHYLRLDKRETKQTDKGPRTKSKGLSLNDMDIIVANLPAVMKALGSKMPEYQNGEQKTAPAAAARPPVASGPVQQDF